MKSIVLDTNCLIASLPSRSPYHQAWSDFVEGKYILCVSNEILTEYEEILAQKTNPIFANAVIKTILNRWNVRKIDPIFNFRLIKSDPDDDKFVNCAICGNARFIVSEDAHFKHLKDIPFPCGSSSIKRVYELASIRRINFNLFNNVMMSRSEN